MKMTEFKIEYGGYLPLELKNSEEYFNRYQDASYIGLNSGRACIIAALDNKNVHRVHIPFYNCHVVEETLIENGYTVCKYLLNEDFLPLISDFKDEDWLVYVDYFGTSDRAEIKTKIAKQYKKVVFDNTQAFYSKPILMENVFNTYSCRKFFGVSDGAYLVYKSGQSIKTHYEKDSSWERASYLLKSIELGTNGAYKDSLRGEESIGFSVKIMSDLTRKILKGIDYDQVQMIRKRNFGILHDVFYSINSLKKIDTSEDFTPMIYPLVVEDGSLREKLVSKNIYVPQWWKYLEGKLCEDSIETKLVKYLLPLPIDQRYSSEDMVNLSEIVIGLL